MNGLRFSTLAEADGQSPGRFSFAPQLASPHDSASSVENLRIFIYELAAFLDLAPFSIDGVDLDFGSMLFRLRFTILKLVHRYAR
jgi:hypothetical protein